MFKSVLIIMVAILLGAMVITPFGPAHVISGSMEPEICAGSTIFLIPAADVVTGDVIVFYPTGLDREMIVHRVVGETPEGYITRGDAVASTDQELGEPPITAERIAGRVFTINGKVLQINYNRFIQLALGICLALGFYWASSTTKIMRKKRLRIKHVQLFVLVFSSIIVTFTMIIGSGADAVSFLASENPGTRTDHIQVGEPGELDFKVSNRSLIPTMVYLEGPESGSTVIVLPLAEITTVVKIPARYEPGWYEISIYKYSYPAVLPPLIINAIYQLSPHLAMLAVLAMMVLSVYIILRIMEPWIPLSLLGGKMITRKYRRLKRSLIP